MIETKSVSAERNYEAVSLSGGGYRAALFHAGVLRALQAAGFFALSPVRHVIVNAVSGGAIPAVLWQQYLHSAIAVEETDFWPEEALLDLVTSTPRLGGAFNWQLRGGWRWARQKWEKFLTAWWRRIAPPPGSNLMERMGAKSNVQFLVEILDFHYGQIFLYDGKELHFANRDFFKTGSGFFQLPFSAPKAVAAASAFPAFFSGVPVLGLNKERFLLKDAGVIDNLAILPLLEILKRMPHDGSRLGVVGFWFLSDAGKPMPVPALGAMFTKGISVDVPKLSLTDRIFRLTGDLAQPHSSSAIISLLQDYADVQFAGVGLDQVWNLEEPWFRPQASWTPAGVPTALCGMKRDIAVAIMTAGAQAASYALLNRGRMQPGERDRVRHFFQELEGKQRRK